ncbi:response regulator [Paenibacillus rhizovicinus]|uniref:Response regulator n=1 Tax=Paenibacillus rhizovicinus TaxID=2704463 RepID=A0A6C0P7W2_9BACL|nr:helix-turn-helix domain-containing protein [Paenibacillus rhizovicinus]QHW34720.1 response regulator [Paenibacillus rhizovicinus]
MIRTLFVEDEFFVRQGFVHSLPWEKFGITIIGEADNGDAALAFLRDNEADMLITDLTMPFKSGLELLKEVNTLYPSLATVVLTCHRDFDFVQEALRLGALDYIVKTRLDAAELESALARISERMSQRQQQPKSLSPGLLLVPIGGEIRQFPERLRSAHGLSLNRIEGDSWFVPDPGEAAVSLAEEADAAGWAAVQITEHWNEDSRIIAELLSSYRRYSFPYRWSRATASTIVSVAELKRQQFAKRQPAAAVAELAKCWFSCGWIFESELFEEWLVFVQRCEPPVGELAAMTEASLLGWRLSDGLRDAGMPEQLVTSPDFIWDRWTEELRQSRDCLLRRYESLHYSRDVYASALKSLEVIRRHLKEGLSQGEVARMVGLSRSYFSQIFKSIFMMSFNDYVKALSISTAQRLLAVREHPIYWIAEQAGFKDERYFSRVFREHTGMLPSEYRIRSLHGSVDARP